MSQRQLNIIRHYIEWKVRNPDTWMDHCRNQPSLADAIRAAALSRNHLGQKHPHQYRLKNINLQNFGNQIVANINNIRNAHDFDTLHNEVKNCRITGIGELVIYDTAVRIGAFLNLTPTVIYLHAGARIGLEKLLGRPISSGTINKNQLPATFANSDLTCYELEDLLCIYKKILQ